MGDDAVLEVRRRLRSQLAASLERAGDRLSGDDLAAYLQAEGWRWLDAWSPPWNRMERVRAIEEALDDLLRLGPLEPLLRDPEVTRIEVTAPTAIRVLRKNRWVVVGETCWFFDREQLARIVGRVVDFARSEGRLVPEPPHGFRGDWPDGSSFAATVPPIAVASPTLTIERG